VHSRVQRASDVPKASDSAKSAPAAGSPDADDRMAAVLNQVVSELDILKGVVADLSSVANGTTECDKRAGERAVSFLSSLFLFLFVVF
jgi:hypothetical protein